MMLGRSSTWRRFISILCAALLFVPSGLVVPLQAAAQGPTHFKVNPDNDSAWGHDWPAYSTVTITVGSLAAPDFQQVTPTDEIGNWSIGELGYDVQPGETVTVEDGVTTKVLVVTSVTAEVNAASDIVTGTAEPLADLWVGIHSDDGVGRPVTADESGDWEADFSVSIGADPNQAAYDIQPGDSGFVEHPDVDSDSTWADWRVPAPNFAVNPNTDDVWGGDWPATTAVTVFVGADPGDPVYFVNTQIDEGGNLNAHLEYDVASGDTITVTDGVTAWKQHVITPLTVDGVDPDTDTVWGTAEPGSNVQVDAWGMAWRHVDADGTGYWAVDFSVEPGEGEGEGTADLGPGTQGEARQQDQDMDSTAISWRVPGTFMRVNPHDDGVWGGEWTPDSTVDIYVGEPGNPDFSTSAETDEWGNFGIGGAYDIVPGDRITVDDGATTKETTSTALTVDGVDPDMDVVWGTAEPGTDVQVNTGGGDWVGRAATADSNGEWSVDFSVSAGPEHQDRVFDIQAGTDGQAGQYDEDGDGTEIGWRVRDNAFKVNPHDDTVWGWDWEPNTALDLFVGDPDNPTYYEAVGTDESGSFGAGLMWDFAPGDVITVMDSGGEKSTVVTALTVDGMDAESDTVWGTADPGVEVQVDVNNTGIWRKVTADGSGNWSADFSVASGAEDWAQPFDIGRGTEGEASQYDDDWDATSIPWRVLDTRFGVCAEDNGVWGSDWPANSTVDITIGEIGGPDYTTTADVNEWGDFGTGLEYDVTAGETVTVSDGTTTKTHVVTSLVVGGVDPDTDTVWGTAEAGSDVKVDVYNMAWRTVVADGAGDWSVDFSVPAAEGEGDGECDIGRGTEGQADQWDEDNDSTVAYWRVSDTGFNVNPYDGSVWGWEWAPNTVVDVYVGTLAPEDFVASATTDDWGNFGTGLEYDLIPGEMVYVTDGATTKWTVVTELSLTGVDPNTDTVWGYATPGSTVDVNAWGMAWRHVTADGSTGAWYADFANPPAEGEGDGTCDIGRGTEGEARQSDEDNDGTAIPWRVPDTSFRVDPHTQEVWGWDWEPSTTVDIWVGDPGAPDHHETVDTDEWGNFGTTLAYDIAVGDDLTVDDGVLFKQHTVTALTVDGVDPDTDTVWGYAEPGSMIDVSIYTDWGGVSRQVMADESSGDWSADFTDAVGEEEWEQGFDIGMGTEGSAAQVDDDGDGTEVPWRVPATAFNVSPHDDSMWGWEWEPNSVVEIKVGDLVTPDYTISLPVSEWGDFGDTLEYDLIAGETVHVTDGTTTKSTVVTELTVDGVDPDTDTVWGHATPGSAVQVDAWGMAWRQVTADETTGEWTADFANSPAEGEGDGTCDIGRGTEGEARQIDEDGDGTAASWRVPDTSFRVNPDNDEVWGWDWTPSSTVDIYVGDLGGPDHSVTVETDEGGSFGTTLDYDVTVGDLITVADGVTEKSTVVTALTVDGVDSDTDTVWGTAAPGATVGVNIYPDWGGGVSRQATADGSGDWSVDFTDAVGEQDWEQGFDIGMGTQGSVSQTDEDNDGTEIGWRVPATAFNVNPHDDSVWGWEWEPNSVVEIKVGDFVTPDYTISLPVSEWGDFGDTLEYDLIAGETVHVTDGTTTKSTVVTELTVDGVDPDTDTVSGHATPGSTVQIDVYGMAWRQVTADEITGEWSADFANPPAEGEGDGTCDIDRGTEGEARQIDEDGDGTAMQWRVPDTSFRVNPDSDEVWGWDWTPSSTVDIYVGDLGAPDHHTTAWVDEWGSFGTMIEYDITVGDLVTITDGVTEKATVVTALTVDGVDPDTDTVWGTAAPGTGVQVDAYGMAWRWVMADEITGDWVADFATPPAEGEGDGTCDIDLGTEGEAAQPDDDGDATALPWRVPNPQFVVEPLASSVDGWDWPAGATIDVFLGDPGNPEQQVQTAADESGSFWADLGFEVVPGDVITVTDGTSTKATTVTNLTVDGVDPDTDTVWGTAAPGAGVQVHIWTPWGEASRWVAADETTGEWTADFSTPLDEEDQLWDIEPGTDGRAYQWDDDWDATGAGWRASSPQFRVNPDLEEVEAWDFEPNSMVDIYVGDPENSDYATSTPTDEWGSAGPVTLDYDIDTGDLITVTDGSSTKDHVIMALTIDSIDDASDIVTGTAEPGTQLQVDVWDWTGEQSAQRLVLADETTGEWTADFSTAAGAEDWEQAFDLQPGDTVRAEVGDEDGDSTWAQSSIPYPRFWVAPWADTIGGTEWLPDTTLDITAKFMGTPFHQTTAQTDSSGDFSIDIGSDVQNGDEIVVTDGVTTKTHVITPLSVDDVDTAADTVSGIAAGGTDVFARLWIGPGSWVDRMVTADGVTNEWAADFSEGAVTHDIVAGDEGQASQDDDDGDSTVIDWLAEEPPNNPPVAVADAYTATEDTARSVAAPGVLANDTDTEGDDLTAIKVSDPAHGTVTLNADGSFTYTPTANYSGADSFTYKVNDGTSDSNTATVSITVTAVNDAPVAADDSYETAEDTQRVVAAPGVLTNDTDAEDDDLTAVKVSNPAHGTVTLNADGSFTYTPSANYSGDDSFTYKVNDGTADSNTAIVSITVTAVNDAPVAVADSYSTTENTARSVSAPGVLANDTDVEDDDLTAVKVSNPAHGTVTFNADGSFTYTPATDYVGADSFTYKANDGTLDSNTVTVSITVTVPNTAPVAKADSYETDEGVALSVGASGVLANDTDAESNPLTADLMATTYGGTLSLKSNGSFTYTPADGFAGTDSFTYRACDGKAYSGTVTVTIVVNADEVIPIAGNDRFLTAIETSVRAYPTGLDPDGALTVVIATGRNWPDALGGTSLAGVLDGPVLLVDTSSVPGSVMSEIDRLGAKKAIILGGTAAVGAEVETALKSELGKTNVERIAGTDRYKTADAVARRVIQVAGSSYDGVAFVATGDNFPDALAAAPLAAAKNWPLYLAHPTKGITAPTKVAMAGVKSVVILGGTAVVPTSVESALKAAYGGRVTRLAGANRYGTAVAVAAYGVQKAGLGWNLAGIATGENFPDALAGGVLQGKAGSVMLLTKGTSLSGETRAALSAHKSSIDSVTYFGGENAVTPAVRDAVAAALR